MLHIIREMQIRILTGHHLAPCRLPIIKKPEKTKHWDRCGEAGTLTHCWGDCNTIRLLWKQLGNSPKSYMQNHRLTQQFHPEGYT